MATLSVRSAYSVATLSVCSVYSVAVGVAVSVAVAHAPPRPLRPAGRFAAGFAAPSIVAFLT